MLPGVGAAQTPINDMHGEVEETQQVLRRYKHNLYRMEADNQHSQKIRSVSSRSSPPSCKHIRPLDRKSVV